METLERVNLSFQEKRFTLLVDGQADILCVCCTKVILIKLFDKMSDLRRVLKGVTGWFEVIWEFKKTE